MQYLKDKQEYIDQYDLRTIEICLDYYQSIKEKFEKNRGLEEFKKYTNKSFDRERQKVLNLLTRSLKGERFRNKNKTIEEWMERDRKVQERYDRAVPPVGILCPECRQSTKVTSKNFLDSYEKDSQVLFMFRCEKCKKGQAFYEDGTEWIYEQPKCPKCQSSLNSDQKDTDEVITTTYSCPKCSYTKEDVYDFKKSRLEREKKEAKDKKLLADYREVFCLSENDGQEYLELTEAMDVGREVYQEELRKYDDPAYQIATHLKKLDITGLEKLLTEKLEKEKYTKLSFGNPEMGQQVIISFTVQDSDSLRESNVSASDLKKLLVATLDDTNWRLMSDGLNYRLGFVSGRLKGYEGEEGMLELAGKRKEPIPRVDSEKRTKYSNHNVVQLQRLYGEVQGRENVRKRRLEKEPKGFAIPAGETYSCHICFTSINSTNGWYDKHGFKCLDCQKAVDEGILPPEVFEEENSWYTDWHVESEFHIPAPTIKKLVRDGKLKPRIVKSSSGRDHAHVFMALENNDLLENYKKKHQIVLLCGIPSSGKSEFGKYLQNKHGYTYISIDGGAWPDNNLRGLWSKVFDEKRQYQNVEKLVCYLYENYENVVLEWNFPMDKIETVALFERQWCVALWFLCNTFVAKEKYIKKNGADSGHLFDKRVKEIEDNIPSLNKRLKPTIINVLKEDKSYKTMEEIYSDFISITEMF